MNIEFDWHVGGEDDQVETLAQVRRRRRRPWPWWIWATLAAVVVCALTGGYLFVQRRYREAQDQLVFQIQSVADLEARAYAGQDRDLFLEQQDARDDEWYHLQAIRIGQDCLQRGSSIQRTDLESGHRVPAYLCQPVLPAEVQDVELRGDVAWVEVVEGDPAVRRARFYRQTDQGWKHTAPRDDFWGVAIQLNYGDIVFLYHRRDQPYVDPLVDGIVKTFDEACAELGCTTGQVPEFNFAIQAASGRPPTVQEDIFMLDSPWLAGILLDETQPPPYQRQLEYAIAYQIASDYLQSLTGREYLSSLGAAMAHEYAAWKSERSADKAPIVGRLVERHGETALPTILRSLEHVRTLNLVMVQWLRLSPTDAPIDYFQTLLNIEQEALVAGRRETYLFLQDNAEPRWVEMRERLFDMAQSNGEWTLAPVKVQTVTVAGDLARVTLENPASLPDGRLLDPRDQTVFFRRRDGDWKHTATVYLSGTGVDRPSAMPSDSVSTPAPDQRT